jgi:hypothetical protein
MLEMGRGKRLCGFADDGKTLLTLGRECDRSLSYVEYRVRNKEVRETVGLLEAEE